MQELTDYFKGLADPSRIRILNLLLHGELCGCDIQYVIAAPQPNISRHLIYLKNSGLVTDRRVGYRVFYSLAEHKHGPLGPLFGLLRQVFQHEETLKRDIQKLKAAIESGSCTVGEWRPYSAITRTKSAPVPRI